MTGGHHPPGIHLRKATRADRVSIDQVIESAMLEIDSDLLGAAIQSRDVLIATREKPDQSNQPDHHTTVVLGAIVLDTNEIVALAVRPRCRGQGIGSALVDAAGEHRQQLVCEFDDRVIDFWRKSGFDIEIIEAIEGMEGANRYRGRRPAEVPNSSR